MVSRSKKRYGVLGIVALGLILALAWTSESFAADKYAPAPSLIDGWTPYDTPVKDLRDAANRNPKYPWNPKGPFPFKGSYPRKDVPYTGEELLWFKDYTFWGAKTQDYAGYTPVANRRGLIVSKNFFIQRTHYWNDFDEILDYTTAGGLNGIFQRVFTLLDAPPENRGFAQVVVKYNNHPGKWKPPDRYQYIPSFRRVRRSRGGDRQDDTMGFPASNDDNGERQWWEYNYEIIAEDVLCEVAGAKGHAILGDPKFIVDQAYMPETVGGKQNPYREDGCLEAWVVKAIPKDPNYYLGYLLYWVEKYTKLELRTEQYDKHGEFWRIDFETTYRQKPGTFTTGGGWTRNLLYGVDYKRDFWTMVFYFDFITGQDIPDKKYTHQELRKEFFWREPKDYRKVTKFQYMPPYPQLYDGTVGAAKPHKDRAGVAQLDPDLKLKIKKHNDFWIQQGGYDAWDWALRTRFMDLK